MSYAGGLEAMRARWGGGLGGPLAGAALAGPLLAGAGLAVLAWVTLRNGRRVGLDDEGRVRAGLPEDFHGVHVADVSPLSRELRQIDRDERDCVADVAGAAPKTFKTAAAGARALLEANPELAELLEADCSQDCLAYRAWIGRGRRGRKPVAGPGDGRFDALNERLELKGHRRVGSWLEAVHVTVPPSRRWSDFSGRLPALEEATGLRLELPAAAETSARALEDARACGDRADELHADAVGRARAGRISTEDLAGVPF